MVETVYILCALASIVCMVLLWRGYRQSRARLLLWSSLCFIGLAGNNVLLLIDLYAVPSISLAVARSATALFAYCEPHQRKIVLAGAGDQGEAVSQRVREAAPPRSHPLDARLAQLRRHRAAAHLATRAETVARRHSPRHRHRRRRPPFRRRVACAQDR